MAHSPCTDIVFIDSLQVSANIGPDCWGRSRPQPVLISVYLHLRNSFLNLSGESDDVRDSVHYGHLSKVITAAVEKRVAPFSGVHELVEEVTREALQLAGEPAAEVRVVVDIPKLILLAAGFSVDVTTPIQAGSSRNVPAKVLVKDLILAVVIGVNPPEREAKQRVITNIIFYEQSAQSPQVEYSQTVLEISKKIESSSYLTLEKFAMEVVQVACLSADAFEAVTVRAQKPSAITFAHSSGVEITRSRSSFISHS